MKSIHSHIHNYKPEPQKDARDTSSARKQEISKLAADKVFEALSYIFPVSYRKSFSNPEDEIKTKIYWAKELAERGVISKPMIQSGLKQARRQERDFFPTVGKFISWCLHDPDDDSFDRYIRREPMCTAAEIETSKDVGYQCRHLLSEQDARRLWKNTLTRYQSEMAEKGIQKVPQERRVEAPEAMTTNLTQEQRDNKTLKNINELLAQGYQPRGYLKSKGIEWGLLNADGSIKQ